MPATPAHWCDALLEHVSRSFALPIRSLAQPMRNAVTVGYLLCRLVDTIEDATNPPAQRLHALAQVREAVLALDPDRLPDTLAAQFHSTVAGERVLLREGHKVIQALAELPSTMHHPLQVSVDTMIMGMSSTIEMAKNGPQTLESIADLEQYCYYVAGVVGEMLTSLFIATHACPDDVAKALTQRAVSFGTALQLTNIIKDVHDDLSRDVCFVPTSMLLPRGIQPNDLTAKFGSPDIEEVFDELISLALSYHQEAVEYILAVPASAPEYRQFCLLPLWMANRTLIMGRDDPTLLGPGKPLKLDRSIVEQLVAASAGICDSDAQLRGVLATLQTA